MLRVILQAQQTVCHKDQPLQHPHHKLEDHHGLPQSTIRRKIQDPPECNGTTNGSTRAPANGKGPGAAKVKNKASEPHSGTSSGTGPATQPANSSKNTIICSGCGESGHWSRNCPYYNFCDFCRVTTHSTHMCRANRHGPRSPVCIYCSKTNHSSAYCRYRPRDNWEEPRNTPDALKSGNNGKNLALAARNQTGSAHHNTNKTPFSHIDGRGQKQPNGGQHRPEHREQPGAAPRGQHMDANPNFPPRRQQHAHFNEGFNRRYSPSIFPSPGFNNTMASDAVGRSIIQLAENQSCSLDFISFHYLDDNIIFSRNEHEHLKHIKVIFQKLIDASLKLKESKCDFFKKEIHYLGHLISSEGIHPLPEKLGTIHNMPRPKTPKEIKQFLGLCSYYRKFVPRFSDIA